MKIGQVIAVLIAVGVIALPLGATPGYFFASSSSQAPIAVTELIMISHVGEDMLVICGTSTFPGGVMQIVNNISTEYLFPQSINNLTSAGKFLKVTIATSTSAGSVVNASSFEFTTTYTVTSMQNNTRRCPIFI